MMHFHEGGRDIMSSDRFSNEEKGASGFSLTKNVCPLSRVHYITTCITESVYTAQWIKQGLFSFFYFPPLHPVNRLHLRNFQTLRYTMKSSVFYDLSLSLSLSPLSNFLQNVYRRKHEIFSYPLFFP